MLSLSEYDGLSRQFLFRFAYKCHEHPQLFLEPGKIAFVKAGDACAILHTNMGYVLGDTEFMPEEITYVKVEDYFTRSKNIYSKPHAPELLTDILWCDSEQVVSILADKLQELHVMEPN